MNTYRFEDIELGLTESFKVTVTSDMMDAFKNITGDVNPLHCDKTFSKQEGFKDRVVYGLLTSSFFSALAGVYLPGEKSLIHETQFKYKKPVFIGDELTISGTVSEIDDKFRVFTMKVSIINQDSEKVIRGSMRIGFLP